MRFFNHCPSKGNNHDGDSKAADNARSGELDRILDRENQELDSLRQAERNRFFDGKTPSVACAARIARDVSNAGACKAIDAKSFAPARRSVTTEKRTWRQHLGNAQPAKCG